MQKLDQKQARIEHANELIKVISSYGRRFFFDTKSGRIAKMLVDQQGRIWFVDDYSDKPIYTHKTGLGNEWRGFSHGGTLRGLVESMRDYIQTGAKIQAWRIAPAYLSSSDDDHWGYGKDAAKQVQQAAWALPIIEVAA